MSARIAAPTMSREALSAVQVEALLAALRRRAAGEDLALPELPPDVEPLVDLLVEVFNAVTRRAVLNGTIKPATEAALAVQASEKQRWIGEAPRLYDVAEIAKWLELDTRQTRRRLRKAGVRGKKAGGRWYFNADTLGAAGFMPSPFGGVDAPMLTVAECAARLGWSTKRMRRMLRRHGVIGDGNKRGERYRISFDDLLKMSSSESLLGDDGGPASNYMRGHWSSVGGHRSNE